jgi:uncharacterized protein (TIGR02145 family)
MKKISYSVFVLILSMMPLILPAQVGINADGSAPDHSAILDVKSSDKGFLPPRMTTEQISVIDSPANGLIVLCTTDNKLYVFNSTDGNWKEIQYGQGIIQPWSCGMPITDSRDAKQYNTVLIGNQCWLRENMNIGTRIQSNVAQSNHTAFEKYCFQNLESNCDIYGGLYQWENAMQWVLNPGAQGICPSGWHVPDQTEWDVLVTYLGGDDLAGAALKEAGTAHWASPNTGTNSSGFTGLGGGYIHYNNSHDLLVYGYFWTSSQYYSFSYAYERHLWFAGNAVPGIQVEWDNAYSVRCVMNP